MPRELTPTEVATVQMAADGMSNKQIASERQTTEQTVKNTFQEIFAKLGADNRAHAVATALRRGVID